MARKVQIMLVDDLDGTDIPEAEAETVTFAIDGVSYEIDLHKKNADKMRSAFEKFVGSARKVGRVTAGSGGRQARAASNGSARTGLDRAQSTAIREWAKAQGKEVSDRGRIPAAIVDEYQSAHAG